MFVGKSYDKLTQTVVVERDGEEFNLPIRMVRNDSGDAEFEICVDGEWGKTSITIIDGKNPLRQALRDIQCFTISGVSESFLSHLCELMRLGDRESYLRWGSFYHDEVKWLLGWLAAGASFTTLARDEGFNRYKRVDLAGVTLQTCVLHLNPVLDMEFEFDPVVGEEIGEEIAALYARELDEMDEFFLGEEMSPWGVGGTGVQCLVYRRTEVEELTRRIAGLRGEIQSKEREEKRLKRVLESSFKKIRRAMRGDGIEKRVADVLLLHTGAIGEPISWSDLMDKAHAAQSKHSLSRETLETFILRIVEIRGIDRHEFFNLTDKKDDDE